MDREDIIFNYFEGDLPEQYQDELFEQLHYDENIRKEFYSQLKIRELVREEAIRIKAPVESRNVIFNNIGLNPNAFKPNKFSNIFANIFNKQNFQKIAIVALLGLLSVSTLIIATNYKAIFYSNSNNYNSSINANTTKPYAVVSSAATNNYTNVENENNNIFNQSNNSIFSSLASYSIFVNQIESSVAKAYNLKLNKLAKDYQAKQKEYIATLNELKQNRANITDNSQSGNSQVKEQFYNKELYSQKLQLNPQINTNLFNSKSNTFQSQLMPTKTNYDLSTLLKDILPNNYNYEFSFNTSQVQVSTPNNTISSNNSAYTFDFGAKKILNRTQKVGLSIGRDIYPQSFSRKIDGKSYTQVQSPQLYYIGLTYQYVPSYFFAQSYVLPVLSAFAGGTSVGPLVKFQLGTELSFFERISLNFGVENTTLFYNVENKIYSTNKVNFVYGINFKL